MVTQIVTLSSPLPLPCGATLKNRIAKSAMSDSLGDGEGHPTNSQINLYRLWAEGGAGLSIVGEVQGDPSKAEKPGNLVLRADSDHAQFRQLAMAGRQGGAHLWAQLGNAGALAHPPIGRAAGPSPLSLDGLTCSELSRSDIARLPQEFAQTAKLARAVGLSGVQIHAAHGFLLSQFLSPLFNHRTDRYGGSIGNRMRLLLEAVDAVRDAVGTSFPVGLKINATDQLLGGFTTEDALTVIETLDVTSLDLIDVSGGTYFPGAPSVSDRTSKGPYFLDFIAKARQLTSKPLMLTGGFKTYEQATDAINSGVDVVGLARALILEPNLPNAWLSGSTGGPDFPRFTDPPEGGVTAWYTMRLTDLAEGRAPSGPDSLLNDIEVYEARDAERVTMWNKRFA